MAKARIERYSAVIEQDLPEIYAFIARDVPAAAERVLDAVEQTLEQLAEQPNCGVSYPTRNSKLKAVRMFPVIGFHDFLVFYRAEAGRIRILYVTHGARHLARLFRREERE